MLSTKYIGLDVHRESLSIAVMNLAAESLHQPVATAVTIVAVVLLNGLILLSLNNSQKEVLSLEYYGRGCALWSFLVPSLAGAAIVLGLVISRGL